jgi:membrane fusion protein (multidrug efflux system)
MSTIALDRDTLTEPGASSGRTAFQLSRKWLLLGGLTALFALGGAYYGYDWWRVGRFVETTDDAYAGGNVTPISPHVAGFVSEILVQDNHYVRSGDLLARLDDRDFQAAVDHAAAVVDQRRASLASLQAKDQLQRSTIREAEANLDAKTVQAAFTQQDDVRYRELAQTSVGSRQNAERASAQNRAAQSAVASSEAGLAAARQQLTVLEGEINQARAAVAQAQADLKTARLNLGYTEIRSPIDGYVGNRAAQVGAYVSGGAYLLTVIPARGLWVDANFKEDQLERMASGQPATVIADVLSGHVFHGRVASVAPGTGAVFSVIPPENATGNFTKIVQRVPVRIELDPDDPMLRALRPGLSTTVSVDTRPGSERTR